MITTFELFSLVGIILEIIGFILLLKYYDPPNQTQYLNWMTKNAQKYEKKKITPTIELMISNWKFRKQLGIYFVIFGLFGQILQIVID